MPDIGKDDVFESEYMARLRVKLARHGVPVDYEKDRVGIDTGLHLFTVSKEQYRASHVRVWFQAKGKRTTTLSLDDYRAQSTIAAKVRVDHVHFWYASPEPVYLVVYVEAADEFVAEDIRDIVDRQWPNGSFYGDIPASQKHVTVHLDARRVLDSDRINAMLRHRSMRIDGPSFRGRPLGHRFDPLRSQIAVLAPEIFTRLVNRMLHEHDFRTIETVELAPDLTVIRGRLYQTLEWQSPAFSEYGYGPADDFRVEPGVESIHGPLTLIIDSAGSRRDLTDDLRVALMNSLMKHESSDRPITVAIAFNSPDLSGTGGLWRTVVREMPAAGRPEAVHHLALEALSFLLLTATLVYLDFAPGLSWDHVNYR